LDTDNLRFIGVFRETAWRIAQENPDHNALRREPRNLLRIAAAN